MIKACSILSIPTYFGAAAIGPDFVVVCFGSKWEASGLVMAMLATAGAASTIGFFSQPVLTAVGRTDAAFIMSLGTLIGNFLVALVTVNFGLTWVALGVSVRGYMTVPLGLHFLTRATGLRIRDVLFGMAPPVASAVVMVALLLAGKAFLLESLHPIVRLAVMVPAGAVIYAACMSVVGRKLLIEVGNELAPIFSRFGLRFGRRADPAP